LLTATAGKTTGCSFWRELDCVLWTWKIYLPFGPGMILLGNSPQEAFGAADSDLCAKMFITALLIRAKKNWKQLE
jgi:hypothetical protein